LIFYKQNDEFGVIASMLVYIFRLFQAHLQKIDHSQQKTFIECAI